MDPGHNRLENPSLCLRAIPRHHPITLSPRILITFSEMGTDRATQARRHVAVQERELGEGRRARRLRSKERRDVGCTAAYGRCAGAEGERAGGRVDRTKATTECAGFSEN